MLRVTLPDGSRREFEKPVSVAEIAADIGPGLAKAAMAGRVNGRLVDTSHVVDQDGTTLGSQGQADGPANPATCTGHHDCLAFELHGPSFLRRAGGPWCTRPIGRCDASGP